MSEISGVFKGLVANAQSAAKKSSLAAAKTANVPGAGTQSKIADVLTRIGPAYKLDGSLPEAAGAGKENLSEAGIDMMKRTGKIECQTCQNRTYQDQSNDPGVSFKAPGNISPGASYAAVSSHEGEHVTNEQANAQKNRRKVVSQSVQIFMAICPECGRAYASGGVTRTTTASEQKTQMEAAAPSGSEK